MAPTLGSIVPDWLLIIPRRPFLSFRDWGLATSGNPVTFVRSVLDHLGLERDEAIWFEHGPGRVGTSVGCGLDHAHLHLLLRPVFGFTEFMQKARDMCHLPWRTVSADEPYDELTADKSYLMAGCGDIALRAEGVEVAGSQFLRRVVAGLAGCDTTWDYKRFSHEANVTRTAATFRSLESSARRGR